MTEKTYLNSCKYYALIMILLSTCATFARAVSFNLSYDSILHSLNPSSLQPVIQHLVGKQLVQHL